MKTETKKSKYKKYESYKDSGIEWLGEVPSEWKYTRIKYLAHLNPSKKEIANLPQDFKVSFVPMESISEEGDLNFTEEKNIQDVVQGYTYVGEDDLIIAKITPCFENGKGAILKGLTNKIGFGSTEFIVIRANKTTDTKYLYYLTKSNHFRKTAEVEMTGSAGQKRVPESFISNFPCPLITLEEQKRISAYIDEKINLINKIIEKKKQLIELLREKRSTLINKAVTKGLDNNAELVDSGIEWIGEIPKGWLLRKVSRSFNIIGSGTTPLSTNESFYEKGNINWLNTGDLRDNFINECKNKITERAFKSSSALKMFPKGSLVIAMYGATIGKVGIMNIEVCVNQACCVLGNSLYFYTKFIYYWFIANRNQIVSLSYGGGQPNISQQVIKNLKIPSPSLQKQNQIIAFLDQANKIFDQSDEEVKKSIKLLEEYKQSLITKVIKGEIKI
jgi:type I restriction enzyme S subunit